MAKLNNELISIGRKRAFEKLKISFDKRLILSLDGGGIRGILTIQLLKKLERIAEIPCFKLFDCVAGTSTGGIIAALIASGRNADQIEELYINYVTKVFDKNFLGDRFINPPKFSKKQFRKIVKATLENKTLEAYCQDSDIDLIISAHDMSAAEETFFTCFKQNNAQFYGTYKDTLLRAAVEATMSAPTYFNPLERFVDGGVTTYNNPVWASIIEAISYSAQSKENIAYDIGNLVVFSLGTGMSRNFSDPNQIDPKGLDIKYWLSWIMNATGHDASSMQVNTLRANAIKDVIDFRRFQISLDPTSIKKLPNINGLDKDKYNTEWLHDIGLNTLDKIDMSDVDRFDLLKTIGTQMAEYIVDLGGAFKYDLVDENGKDLLITKFGDIERIKSQMSDPTWLDKFKV